MPDFDDKYRKLMALANGPNSTNPMPTVPELPAFLKERYPQYAAQMDAYRDQWIEFFKKTGTIAQ